MFPSDSVNQGRIQWLHWLHERYKLVQPSQFAVIVESIINMSCTRDIYKAVYHKVKLAPARRTLKTAVAASNKTVAAHSSNQKHFTRRLGKRVYAK